MGDYTGTIITDAGLEWQADVDMRLIPAEFTRAVMGCGTFAEGIDLAAVTELPEPRRFHSGLHVERRGSKVVRIEALFDNRDLEEGFYIHWIGLYARGRDDKEVAVALAAAGSKADYLSTVEEGSLIELTHNFIITVGRAEVIIADSNDLSSFTPRADFRELEERVSAVENNGSEAQYSMNIMSTELSKATERLVSLSSDVAENSSLIGIVEASAANAHSRLDGLDAGISSATERTIELAAASEALKSELAVLKVMKTRMKWRVLS